MLYRILSDGIVAIHFLWIIFMILGFVLTVWYGFRAYVLKRSTAQADRFFDRWIFRSLHLAGIGFVMTLMLVGQYCPLTVLENYFRAGYDPQGVYPGSFIIHHLERLIYPNISPLVLIVPTVVIAVFCVIMYILRPPQQSAHSPENGLQETLKPHSGYPDLYAKKLLFCGQISDIIILLRGTCR